MLANALDPDTRIDAGVTVEDALALGAAALETAGVERAPADAAWLLASVFGVSRSRLALEPRRSLTQPDALRYVERLRRRLTREPLQHILGTQEFHSVSVRVGPEAMVPRPETETLVDWALVLLPSSAAPLVADVGTGTGCIACAIARARPDATVVALELSPAAVELARANAAALGLADRITVVESDLLAALGARRVHLIVANPPYLPTAVIPTLPAEVSRFDPVLALDGGADGLDILRRIVAAASSQLVPGGVLVVETAGGDQATGVAALMRAAGFQRVQTRADLPGVQRFVAGEMP